MAVSVLHYTHNKKPQWGVLENDRVFAIGRFADLSDFLNKGRKKALSFKPRGKKGLPISKVEILSPITPPCQILCQGKNYLEHMKETGSTRKAQPFNLIFQKSSSAICPGVGQVVRPPGVTLLDYECSVKRLLPS